MAYGPLRLTAMERAKLIDAAERYAEQMRRTVNAGAVRPDHRIAIAEGFINAVEDILYENYEYMTEPASQFKTPE